jgi:hypothetical protein
MKITSPMFIKKAVEQYSNYMRKKEDETAFKLTQEYLEDLAVACKEKGIKEINGQNYTLKMN